MTPAGAPCPHCGYENRPVELTCNLCGAVLAHEARGVGASPTETRSASGSSSPHRPPHLMDSVGTSPTETRSASGSSSPHGSPHQMPALKTAASTGQRGQLSSEQSAGSGERDEKVQRSGGIEVRGIDSVQAPTSNATTRAPTINPRRDFFVQIAANKRRSVLLLTLIAGLLMMLGAVIGEAIEPRGWPIGLGYATLASVVIGLVSYFQGSAIVLAASNAHPVTREEEPQLHNVVEEMAIAAGLPAPAVYLIEDTAPNAFATGRNPQHAAITVTRGLLDKLNRDELQGVVGHEMSHVRNLDIRFSMLVAILVGSIVLFCDLFLRSFRFGRTGRDRREGAWPLVLLALLLAIIAPIFATLLQMAISRQREYLADVSSVQLTRNPLGLANALAKIAGDPEPLEAANRATQHLYIVNPLKVFGMNASALMSTHPPTEARIKILRSMT